MPSVFEQLSGRRGKETRPESATPSRRRPMEVDLSEVVLSPTEQTEVDALATSIKEKYDSNPYGSITHISLRLKPDSTVSTFLIWEDSTRVNETGPEESGISICSDSTGLDESESSEMVVAKAI